MLHHAVMGDKGALWRCDLQGSGGRVHGVAAMCSDCRNRIQGRSALGCQACAYPHTRHAPVYGWEGTPHPASLPLCTPRPTLMLGRLDQVVAALQSEDAAAASQGQGEEAQTTPQRPALEIQAALLRLVRSRLVERAPVCHLPPPRREVSGKGSVLSGGCWCLLNHLVLTRREAQ